MRLWVTRSRPGADRLAARLRALGHEVLVDPLTAVVPLRFEPDLDGVTALAFTSGHGVRRFADVSPRRDLPVWAIGRETAQAATEAGFEAVVVSRAHGAALAEDMKAQAGRVLWVRGRRVAFDLAKALAGGKLWVRSAHAYDTRPRPAPDGLAALGDGRLDGVILQSLGAVEALIDQFGPVDAAPARAAVAFVPSARVAEALGAAPFSRIEVADTPDEDGLIALLGKPRAAV